MQFQDYLHFDPITIRRHYRLHIIGKNRHCNEVNYSHRRKGHGIGARAKLRALSLSLSLSLLFERFLIPRQTNSADDILSRSGIMELPGPISRSIRRNIYTILAIHEAALLARVRVYLYPRSNRSVWSIINKDFAILMHTYMSQTWHACMSSAEQVFNLYTWTGRDQ